MAVRKCLACLCYVLLLGFVLSAERKTRDMIYKDIISFAPCVRRFNRDNQTGCSSDMNGNTGVVHYIENLDNLDWLLNKGPHEPYMPILSPQMFTAHVVKKLADSPKVNGMLVIHTNVEDQVMDANFSFSPDQSCPNEGFGYGSCGIQWNKPGSNLFALDFNIPIFALTDEDEVQSIVGCYNDTNKPNDKGEAQEYPLCAVELKDFMFGAVNTEICMRRSTNPTNIEYVGYCDPLSDYNVWGTLKPTNKKDLHTDSVIIAAAPLDSTSLFYNVTPEPGVELAATGFITLLSAAYALGSLSEDQKSKLDKNILFAFFHGESYDYIGSSRTVFDMQRNQFPVVEDNKKEQPAQVNLENIAMFLELRQLGLPQDQTYFAHKDPDSEGGSYFFDILQDAFRSTSVSLKKPPNGQRLPPASFQSFLRKNSSIDGLVITDHETYYNNRFYNSRFEVASYLGLNFTDDEEATSPLAEKLNDVATAVANALYVEAVDNASVVYQLEANINITSQLIYCFLYRPTCSLFQSVVDEENVASLSKIPYQFYIGVHPTEAHRSPFASLVQKLLASFIPLDINNKIKSEDCKNAEGSELFDYTYMQGPDRKGTCVKSATGFTVAVSPAFVTDVDGFPQWKSEYYSTWTESAWQTYTARLFLKPSRQQESLIFSLGMIVILISFPLVYIINLKSETLFSRE
ncbi:nicastrin-like [Anneissia japonica]|uniref:nicastrin-like n=1 Tax=Anneissia japonica TaxID=1529436 RepID=UPI0014256FFD|nr:nicastrin-like [Anneissia japonica]